MKKNFILFVVIVSAFILNGYVLAADAINAEVVLNHSASGYSKLYSSEDDAISFYEFQKSEDLNITSIDARPFYFNFFDGAPVYRTSYAQNYLDQEEVLSSFNDFMLKNEFPRTDDFIVFLQELIQEKCRGTQLYDKCHMRNYKYALQILRSSNQIDNLFYLIVDDRIRNYKPSFKDLSDYLRSLKSLYLKRLSDLDGEEHDVYDVSFLNTRSLSQEFGRYNGLTPRQVLYLKYDSFQIKYLGYQLKKMINVMNSENAYIHVDMEADDINDIHLELSYSEKYRLGVKLLKFHLNELQFDSRFGFKPRYIDVLLSGVETGVIRPELLKEFYAMPEFYDSYRNRYSIYKEALKRIGKQILINTPVVGQLAFIPIMIIEIRNELQNGTRNQSDDTHIF